MPSIKQNIDYVILVYIYEYTSQVIITQFLTLPFGGGTKKTKNINSILTF